MWGKTHDEIAIINREKEKAAEIAGLSRVDFIDALGRFRVSPFQCGTQEILAEISDAN